jgi:ABC-type amino acid transport substrate-binding protein
VLLNPIGNIVSVRHRHSYYLGKAIVKYFQLVLTILLSAAVAFATVKYVGADKALAPAVQESAFDRVMRTKTLRCSYVIYEPYFMIDPNSHEKSGIFYEATGLIAQKLGLKVEWTNETNYATLEADLQGGKADMFCGGLWEDTQKANFVQYSTALSYAPVFAYVRVSPQTDGLTKLEDIKAGNLKIVFMDGEMSHLIYQRLFSSNPFLSLASMNDESVIVENIASGKADATFIEPAVANAYLAKNPGKFRALNAIPIQTFANTYGVVRGEQQLIDLFNVAIHSGLNSGEIQAITKKYMHSPEEILMPLPPYQTP